MASSWLNPSVDGDVGCNNPLPIGKLQVLASSEFGTPPKPTSKRRRGKNQAATDDAQLQQTSSNAASHRSLRPQTRSDPESWPLIANKKQKKLSPSWQPRQHQSPLKPLGSKQSRGSSSWHDFVRDNFDKFANGQTAGAVDGSSANQQMLPLGRCTSGTTSCENVGCQRFGDRIKSIAKAWKQKTRPSTP